MKHSSVYLVIWMLAVLAGNTALAQESGKYLLGAEQQLQIKVYVLGEVSKPGEYLVSDNTDVVELLSKAGGTTEFSSLSAVTITRKRTIYDEDSPLTTVEKEIIRFDVKDYLNNRKAMSPPVLKPGDVVFLRRNAWSKWRAAFTIVRDLSVVASAYFLYVRANKL